VRTENFKHGVVYILLVFGLVFSMISVAPLASPGDWVNDPAPGGTIIQVVQGENFLIRHVLEFDQPENGSYTITISWKNYENKPEENFTFLMAEAYFTTGPNAGESTQADVTMAWAPSGSDTSYALSVARPADNKDPRNGQFNVDIWMGAYGVGGIPHISGDHVIPFQLDGIIIIESSIRSWDRGPITIKVLPQQPGVKVDISPTSQEGVPGATLTYSVTVSNTGDIYDNYDLAASDNENWGPTLSENLLDNVGPGENRVITLSVTIPENATSFNEDNIRVTATSAENVEVSGSDWCIARVQGKAEFDHITLYKVSLDVDLYLGSGLKLVAKFYTWGSSYQGENVVWTGSTPDNVSFFKYLPHPLGSMVVQIVKLDLTYDTTENVIQRIASFVVRKEDIEQNFMRIPLEWALAQTPEERLKIEIEFMEKPLYWVMAPL